LLLAADRCIQTGVIRALSNSPVNGRWLLTGLAGRGASSVVYRAFDLVAERVVALKAMGRGPRAGAPAPGFRPCRTARREFLDLARLRHPNLVETYELARVESGPLPRGSAFFTMELLDAATDEPGAAGPSRVARLALDVLSGLDCVHTHGLVHGDVKPSNVLVDLRWGRPLTFKLSDMGLAGPPTRSRGALRGTLQYAAPETLTGSPVDHRADLYSLGVLLFEAATGVLPFDSTDPAAALEWHLRGGAGADEAGGSGLPPTLSRAVGRLLARRPTDRPARAREVREMIEDALPDEAARASCADGACDGPLVGREAERGKLTRWLVSSARTGGRLEIVGPPGAGLSRLAREAALLGRAEGWSVHASACEEGGPPFAPFLLPLREILLGGRSGSGSADGAKRGVAAARGLQSLFGVSAAGGHPAEWPSSEPIVPAVADLLHDASRRRPLLLVIDDYERGDATVSRTLGEAARQAAHRSSRLLIVTISHDRLPCGAEPQQEAWLWPRGWAVPPAEPWRPCVLGLGPLSGAACRRLIAALPGIGPLGRDEVDGVIRASAGLPGRLVRLARAVAGRQRPLFPPLYEPIARA
jgi:hypothetical protein